MDKEIEIIREKVKCGYLRVGKLVAITNFGSVEKGIEHHEGEGILIECMHPRLYMFGCLVNDGRECPYRSLEAKDAVDKQEGYIPF